MHPNVRQWGCQYLLTKMMLCNALSRIPGLVTESHAWYLTRTQEKFSLHLADLNHITPGGIRKDTTQLPPPLT